MHTVKPQHPSPTLHTAEHNSFLSLSFVSFYHFFFVSLSYARCLSFFCLSLCLSIYLSLLSLTLFLMLLFLVLPVVAFYRFFSFIFLPRRFSSFDCFISSFLHPLPFPWLSPSQRNSYISLYFSVSLCLARSSMIQATLSAPRTHFKAAKDVNGISDDCCCMVKPR